MKLSVITDEISMDVGHALDVMREYGVRGAELRSLWGKNIVDLTDEEVEDAQRIIRKKGATVSCIASPLFKCDLSPGSFEAAGQTHQAKTHKLTDQKAVLDRCVGLALSFGTPLIRVFSFWRRGDLTPDIEDRIVQGLSPAAETAGRAGISLVLENEHACYVGTGAETARVLRRVNSPHLRAVWDPGNAFCAGEAPFPDGYEAVKDYVEHVHIKDAVRLRSGECRFVAVGEGQIDYLGQFEALRQAGYTGWLSLETHFAPASGDKEEGSRSCLDALVRMVPEGAGSRR